MILDIQMPVLDGLAAAEQIASARIAPVIVLTAFSQRELVERARDAGAMAYLVKPFSKNDLVPAIEVARGPVRGDDRAGRRGAARWRSAWRPARSSRRPRAGSWRSSGMTEAEAFRWIQRTAMNERTSMKALAQSILAGDAPPVPGPA